MIKRVARLLAAEALKLSSQPFIYVSLGLIAAGAILAEELFIFTQARKASMWSSPHAVHIFASGWWLSHTIASVVLVIFSSLFFAGEFDRGTIKVLLTRPITRTELFTAKAVTVLALALVLYGFTLWVTYGWALWRGNIGPVWDDTVYYVHQSASVIESHLIRALGVAALSFLAAGFLGFLVSTWTESSAFAVAMALVLFLFGWLFTVFFGGDGFKENFFFHYGPYAADKLKELAGGGSTRWSPQMVDQNLHVKIPLYYMAVFIPAAYALFRFKNITA